ncbi:hypothetical protein HA464_32030 (plasmid) [Rhizobium leguminosarum bv. trifolii]|uniref:hypothetical protein n=1 Tax=Rhizobium ruizarguesonis TaxID=2081791 RepID=UPI001030F91D|nr:hypothetical protein [Rhizobium ruizarguesonis]QIO48591.1 hypothetical protein HA464_32030 [Rhizobium leguminosarum bv. trifolii]TAW40982.1 hypothetical protein ELI17_31800 [Rhizobium ruizarguesonis]TAY09554.1 hypothetical protein ELH92_28335 [Rhizobium ruizarguesonis]
MAEFGYKRIFLAHGHDVLLSRRYLLVRAMTGKFLRRGAIADTIKSDEQMNAQQKRAGKTRYHADVVSCGCPDENCGAFHVLRTERPFPQSPKPRVRWLRTNGPEKLATIDGNTTAAGKAG